MIRRNVLRDEDGAAAVEFALTSPLYFLLLFGLFQVSIWLWSDFSLQRAVDVASRCAAVTPTTCGTTSQIQAYAASNAIGLPVSSSTFTAIHNSCGAGSAQVSAKYTVPSLTSALGLPSITVNVSACYPT